MIEIEILKTTNLERLGTYTIHKNIIYIGNHYNNDIYLPETEFINNNFFIECVEDKLIIHPHKDLDRFHINSKIVTTYKYLNIGDEIEYLGTKLKIISFEYELTTKRKDLLNKAVADLDKTIPEKLQILELLSKHEL